LQAIQHVTGGGHLEESLASKLLQRNPIWPLVFGLLPASSGSFATFAGHRGRVGETFPRNPLHQAALSEKYPPDRSVVRT
jgi:hypothetical protein